MLAVGPPVDGTLVAGRLVSGGGALLVTGALAGGGEPAVGGGGELDVGSLGVGGFAELGGGSDEGGAAEDGGPEDGGPLVGPGLLGPELPDPEDDGGGAEPDGGDVDDEDVDDEDGDDGDHEDVDGVEPEGSRVDPDEPGADPVPDPDCGGVDVPLDEPPDVAPPATLNVTYSPNRSSVPAGGSDAVTRALSGGSPPPAKAAASPVPASRRLACPNVVPARSGTARRSRVSNAVSSSPVVPTGRLTPRAGSWTSTRASSSTSRVAGRTATTDDFS